MLVMRHLHLLLYLYAASAVPGLIGGLASGVGDVGTALGAVGDGAKGKATPPSSAAPTSTSSAPADPGLVGGVLNPLFGTDGVLRGAGAGSTPATSTLASTTAPKAKTTPTTPPSVAPTRPSDAGKKTPLPSTPSTPAPVVVPTPATTPLISSPSSIPNSTPSAPSAPASTPDSDPATAISAPASGSLVASASDTEPTLPPTTPQPSDPIASDPAQAFASVAASDAALPTTAEATTSEGKSSSGGLSQKSTIIVGVASGAGGLVTLVVAVWLLWRCRMRRSGRGQRLNEDGLLGGEGLSRTGSTNTARKLDWTRDFENDHNVPVRFSLYRGRQRGMGEEGMPGMGMDEKADMGAEMSVELPTNPGFGAVRTGSVRR